MIKIENREIKRLLSAKLIEMKIRTPHTQRIIEKSKVKDIVTYQLEYLRMHKRNNFLGIINIHYLEPTKNYFLVDGQHRFAAIKELYNKYSHDLEILVEIVKVKTYSELVENYNLINKNTPLPELPLEIDQTIPEKTTLHFQEKYPDVWGQKSKTKRPKVLFNSFQETLGCITKNLQDEISSSVELIKKVEKVNQELGLWEKEKFKGVSEGMYQKAKQANFFLGLLSYKTNDYPECYEWGKIIIDKSKKPGPSFSSKPKTSKKQIPVKVKNDSWDKNIGKECGEAYCIVCDHTPINSKNFQAGHIISEKNGGKAIVDNILPICGQCNRSMSSKNMRDFIQKNYPSNLENFDTRTYRV